MIEALLHGKLSREQENMEDILTSNVFGALRYAPATSGLLRFLACAATIDGKRPLAAIKDVHELVYEFWPRWRVADGSGCEPDVVIGFTDEGGRKHLVLVEAKLFSGKSNGAELDEGLSADQLAREWRHLRKQAIARDASPLLVYLTAHVALPKTEIEESLVACRLDGSAAEEQSRICWLTWRMLPDLFSGDPDPALCDLAKLAKRLNLTFFTGFSLPNTVELVAWAFRSSKSASYAEWQWELEEQRREFSWSFNR